MICVFFIFQVKVTEIFDVTETEGLVSDEGSTDAIHDDWDDPPTSWVTKQLDDGMSDYLCFIFLICIMYKY